MKVYLINLDRHPERLALISARLAGVEFERITAIDGRELSGPMVREHGAPFAAETLTRFERACIESHREAWRRFLETDDQVCCVIEDDVQLAETFRAFVAADPSDLHDIGLIKIERATKDPLVCGPASRLRDRELRALLSPHLGSAGYLIGRDHAKALLAATAAATHPVDWILFHPELNPAGSVLQLLPALCQQVSLSGEKLPHPSFASSIQYWGVKPKKTLATRIRREIDTATRRLRRSKMFRRREQLAPVDGGSRLIHLDLR